MTVNHGCDVCVCVSGLRMKRRAKVHQGMLCIQWIERRRKRERSLAQLIFEWWQFFRVETWPPFNLSILRHENGRKGREEGGWGDQSRYLLLGLVPDWFLLYITFILRETIKLTYPLTRTQWMAKTEMVQLWLTVDTTFVLIGWVPAHGFIIAFWSIDKDSNKYTWPLISPS